MPWDCPRVLPESCGKHPEVTAIIRGGIVDNLSRGGALNKQGLDFVTTEHAQPPDYSGVEGLVLEGQDAVL